MKTLSRYHATNQIIPNHKDGGTRSPTRTKRIHGPNKKKKYNSTVALGKNKRNIESTCTINQNESRLIIERLDTLECAMRIVMESID